MTAVAAARNSLGSLAFVVPFVLIGAYISVGRLLVRRCQWRRSRYSVTDSRIVTATGSQQETFWLDQLPPPVITRGSCLGFGSTLSVQSRLAMQGWPLASMSPNWIGSRYPVLVGIDDVDQLQQLVRTAQHDARNRRTAPR